jgi:alkyl hydroperoxide reductase subunit AhpF
MVVHGLPGDHLVLQVLDLVLEVAGGRDPDQEQHQQCAGEQRRQNCPEKPQLRQVGGDYQFRHGWTSLRRSSACRDVVRALRLAAIWRRSVRHFVANRLTQGELLAAEVTTLAAW